ncbi:MAG TPA: hypothetical protein VMZ53_16070 [Kofleriaceae bacterium]|nr:hypothetical protein [Kofleriaceae bacterium]
MRIGLRAVVAGAILASAALATTTLSRAHAESAVLAGIATPAPGDARKAIAVGPQGQVYEPDGKGAWVRKKAGGTGDEIIGAQSANGTIVADAKGSSMFRLEDNGWTSIRVAQKGGAILGAGTRLLAAAGKTIFALDKRSPTKLAEAPLPVLAVAGTIGGGVVVATAKGFFGLQGTAFKQIKNAPRGGTLLSDRFLLVSNGVFDLKTQRTLTWPAGLKITDTALVGADMLVAVGSRGKTFELVTVKASGAVVVAKKGAAKGAKGAAGGGAAGGGAAGGGAAGGGGADTETIPLPNASRVVGLVADKAGRVVVATRDGHIAVREVTGGASGASGAAGGANWTVSEVREELPEAKPGPAPAEVP